VRARIKSELESLPVVCPSLSFADVEAPIDNCMVVHLNTDVNRGRCEALIAHVSVKFPSGSSRLLPVLRSLVLEVVAHPGSKAHQRMVSAPMVMYPVEQAITAAPPNTAWGLRVALMVIVIQSFIRSGVQFPVP